MQAQPHNHSYCKSVVCLRDITLLATVSRGLRKPRFNWVDDLVPDWKTLSKKVSFNSCVTNHFLLFLECSVVLIFQFCLSFEDGDRNSNICHFIVLGKYGSHQSLGSENFATLQEEWEAGSIKMIARLLDVILTLLWNIHFSGSLTIVV